MFCSFYLILYIIWFHFSFSLGSFYYFDYYEHQCFTSVLFHMFSFNKNALFGSSSWMFHRIFIESSTVTMPFWLDQYGGRFASIFRRCPPSMFWGQCDTPEIFQLGEGKMFIYLIRRYSWPNTSFVLMQSHFKNCLHLFDTPCMLHTKNKQTNKQTNKNKKTALLEQSKAPCLRCTNSWNAYGITVPTAKMC